jgi:hypothetical protein
MLQNVEADYRDYTAANGEQVSVFLGERSVCPWVSLGFPWVSLGFLSFFFEFRGVQIGEGTPYVFRFRMEDGGRRSLRSQEFPE